jgi:hypothetical protein
LVLQLDGIILPIRGIMEKSGNLKIMEKTGKKYSYSPLLATPFYPT